MVWRCANQCYVARLFLIHEQQISWGIFSGNQDHQTGQPTMDWPSNLSIVERLNGLQIYMWSIRYCSRMLGWIVDLYVSNIWLMKLKSSRLKMNIVIVFPNNIGQSLFKKKKKVSQCKLIVTCMFESHSKLNDLWYSWFIRPFFTFLFLIFLFD